MTSPITSTAGPNSQFHRLSADDLFVTKSMIMVKLGCGRFFACASFAGCALRLTAAFQLFGFVADAPDMLPRQAPIKKKNEEPRFRLGRGEGSSREAVNNHEVSLASYRVPA